MPTIETIKVKNKDSESGFYIINKSDYLPGVHEPFDENAPVPEQKPTLVDIPDGTSVKKVKGGGFQALVGDKPLVWDDGKDAGKPVVFEDEASAREALVAWARNR